MQDVMHDLGDAMRGLSLAAYSTAAEMDRYRVAMEQDIQRSYAALPHTPEHTEFRAAVLETYTPHMDALVLLEEVGPKEAVRRMREAGQ